MDVTFSGRTMSSLPLLRSLGPCLLLTCTTYALARASESPEPRLEFAELDGVNLIELFHLSEAQLRFRWLTPLAGELTDCAREGLARAIAPPSADPEIEDVPDGEVFAGREYWHASDTDCMLSLVVELEPTRWLQVERLDCTQGEGCAPTATRLFRRSGSGD